MKKVIFLSMIIGIMSCNKNKEPDTLVTENSYLKVEAIKEYLPSQYFNEVKIVYKNQIGEERKLSTFAKESTTERMHNGIPYTTDQFEITLYDPTNTSFSIVLTGSTNYATSGETIVLTLNGTLMPFNSSGTTWGTIQFKNEQPIISLGDDFIELYTIYGKEFNNTYIYTGKNNEQVQYSAYSELILNSENGVVAFRDMKNELWVSERFEE